MVDRCSKIPPSIVNRKYKCGLTNQQWLGLGGEDRQAVAHTERTQSFFTLPPCPLYILSTPPLFLLLSSGPEIFCVECMQV
jgi:hypothetical protein